MKWANIDFIFSQTKKHRRKMWIFPTCNRVGRNTPINFLRVNTAKLLKICITYCGDGESKYEVGFGLFLYEVSQNCDLNSQIGQKCLRLFFFLIFRFFFWWVKLIWCIKMYQCIGECLLTFLNFNPFWLFIENQKNEIPMHYVHFHIKIDSKIGFSILDFDF